MNVKIHNSSYMKNIVNGKVVKDEEAHLNFDNNQGELFGRKNKKIYYQHLNKNQLYALLNPNNRSPIINNLMNLGGEYKEEKKKKKAKTQHKTLKKGNKKVKRKRKSKTLKSTKLT